MGGDPFLWFYHYRKKIPPVDHAMLRKQAKRLWEKEFSEVKESLGNCKIQRPDMENTITCLKI